MVASERHAGPAISAMADERTPLVLNAWYVAALSGDIGAGELFARTIAGRRIVLYRASDGTPVALDDRCAHRSFPLSKGSLEGGEIVCGYHGFRYGSDGICTTVPSQAAAPRGIGVRAYPLVEQAPLIWMWPGDPDIAATQPVPSQAWMQPGSSWELATGYLTLRASYVHMHENLLDLTHIGYLHAKTFGSPEYASAPFETVVEPSSIVVKRTVSPTFLPPVYAEPLGLTGRPAERIVTSEYVAPGLSISAVTLRDLAAPPEHAGHRAATAHLITPIGANEIHYHFLVGRDFARGDARTSDFMMTSLRAVFAEDQYALEAITEVRSTDAGAHHDRSVASDKAGIAMRRLLQRLADAERSGERAR